MANAIFSTPAVARVIPEAVPQASAAAHARECVLIVEPNFTGHRWRYAQWAADAFIEAGYACLIITESCNEDHRLARKITQANRAELEIAFIDPPEPRRAGLAMLERIPYLRYHRYFHHAYRLVSAFLPTALVVVPYVDYFLYALPFLGSPFGTTPWIGITMRSTFHHHQVGVKAPARPLVNAVKSGLFRQAVQVRGMRALLSIDPTLPEWSARWLGKRAAEVAYLADPFPDARADDPAQSRARLGLGTGRLLLVYGSITERKGIRELIAALEHMPDAPTLVVAGEQDADTREFLLAHRARLNPSPVMFDMFVTNEMEHDLFSACDVVWLGYKGHYGMSGVLVQAYRFGRPVVATAEGLIGWFCHGGQLGPLLDDLAPQTIGSAIEAAFAHASEDEPRSADAAPSTPHDRHARLLERNTLEQFKRTLREAFDCDAD